VIRFSCPHCSRAYILPDALARLPLICKGCGQRLNVPEPEPEPEPLPPPPVKPPHPAPITKPPPAAAAHPPEPMTTLSNGPGGQYHATVEPDLDDSADADLFCRPPEPPEHAAAPPRIPPPVKPAAPARPRRGIGFVVDATVFLTLLAGGVIAAEMLLGKSSATVLRESSAAPKFPPTDLLIWLAGPVLLGLIYVWLGTRGWTVGGWLRRRAAE
jgi:hypothetical protein